MLMHFIVHGDRMGHGDSGDQMGHEMMPCDLLVHLILTGIVASCKVRDKLHIFGKSC